MTTTTEPRAGSYRCRVGCGQTFLTEAARDAHEETCNGGVDLARELTSAGASCGA